MQSFNNLIRAETNNIFPAHRMRFGGKKKGCPRRSVLLECLAAEQAECG